MKKGYDLILRIIILFLISYSLLNIIITPVTIYLSYYLLKLFGENVILLPPFLILNQAVIKFIPACAAISAYYLLMLLILLTRDIKPLIRLKMFLLGSLIILIINTLRVTALLITLSYYGLNLFESIHIFLWILVGSVLVALVWIFLVKRYKVKTIPIYSDLKYLFEQTKIYKCIRTRDRYGIKGKHRGNKDRRAKTSIGYHKKSNRKKR